MADIADVERFVRRINALQSSMTLAGPTARTGRALTQLAGVFPGVKQMAETWHMAGPYERKLMVRDALCAAVRAIS